MRQTVRYALAYLLFAVIAAVPAEPLAQGGRARGPSAAPVPEPRGRVEILVDDLKRADETRRQLRRLMESYSPALGRVLRLDPTLISNESYLAPYPELVTFLQTHPEVVRDPDYFLNFVVSSPDEPVSADVQARRETMRMWRDFFFAFVVFAGFGAAVLSLGWLIRYAIGHRRWLRTVKLQSDVHGRLMERFASNDDLMAYIQSPAGRQFLQGLPAAPDVPGPSAIAPPINRILWSVQAGLVIGAAGAGLLFIRGYMIEEVAEIMLVFGGLGVSLGIGFALAAAASYMLSHRLGLFDADAAGTARRD